jgi:hypothetical protein
MTAPTKYIAQIRTSDGRVQNITEMVAPVAEPPPGILFVEISDMTWPGKYYKQVTHSFQDTRP